MVSVFQKHPSKIEHRTVRHFPLFQILRARGCWALAKQLCIEVSCPVLFGPDGILWPQGMMRNRVPLGFKEQGEVQKHQNIFLPRTLDCSVRG